MKSILKISLILMINALTFFVILETWPIEDDWQEMAKKSACRAEINNLKTAVIQYKLQTGEWPGSFWNLVNNKKGKSILKKIPLDPWNEPYILLYNSKTIIIKSRKISEFNELKTTISKDNWNK